MTEKEREEELFKRAENRENLRKRFEISKKLKQKQKLEGGEKKKKKEETESSEEEGQRKSGADDSEEDIDYSQMWDAKGRSQERKKTLDSNKFDSKSSALSELRAKKEERERKEKEKKEKKEREDNKDRSRDDDGSDSESDHRSSGKKKDDRGRHRRRSSSSSSSASSRRRSSSSSSSASSSDRSDVERRPSERVKRYVETQEDLEPIRLSRHKMEKFVHLPFFRKLVQGCFVRIGIGSNDQRPVYRCTEVVDVVETGKVYNVGRARTNTGLKLKFGKQERVFRLEFISNSPLTPTEFLKWKDTMEQADFLMPTKDFVQSKHEEIKKALSYEFTSADVDHIIEKKEKFNKNPKNYAMYKARLMKEKEIAQTEGDQEKASELETQLNDLEHRAEELDKRRTGTTTITAVALINNRNRRRNVEKAELAIMEEIERKKVEGVIQNPFLRRKCNPRMVTKQLDEDPEAEALKKLAEEKERQEKENREKAKAKEKPYRPPPGSAIGESQPKKKLKTSAASEAAAKKEDLFDAHNFDIEIDVDTIGGGGGGGGPSSAPVSMNVKPLSMAPKDNGPTKRLNLSEYKKKKGFI